MNPVEIINVIPQTEVVESTAIEEFNTPRQPSPGAMYEVRLRYALLAVIALLLTWITLTTRNSIREIEAEVEMIRAQMVTSDR